MACEPTLQPADVAVNKSPPHFNAIAAVPLVRDEANNDEQPPDSSSAKPSSHNASPVAMQQPPHMRARAAQKANASSSSYPSTSDAFKKDRLSSTLSRSDSTAATAVTRVKHVYPATAHHDAPEVKIELVVEVAPAVQSTQPSQPGPVASVKLTYEERLKYMRPRQRGPIPTAAWAAKPADTHCPLSKPPKIRGSRQPGTYQSWPPESPIKPTSKSDIEKKLAEHGVKVSAPQPVQTHSTTQVYYGKRASNKKKANDAGFQKLLGPTRTLPSGPKPRNERWTTPPRASRWPSKADFPKVSKSKYPWDINFDEDAACKSGEPQFKWFEHDHIDNSYKASREPNLGSEKDWNAHSRNAPVKPNQSKHSLIGFDGKLAPAPEDWDSRPPYTSLNTTANIKSWIGQLDDSIACNVQRTDDLIDGIRAPRSWIPRKFGNQTLMAVWRELMSNASSPRPTDETDLAGVQPWWTQYQSQSSELLLPIVHPPQGIVDPCELHADRINRENDYGSLQHIDNCKRKEWAKAAAIRDQRKQLQGLVKKYRHVSGYKGPLKPAVSMYIRPARREDLVQIRDIYNYYVSFSTTVCETEDVTTEAIEREFLQAQKCGLPFLVAIQRGKRFKYNKWSRPDRHDYWQEPDKVVGFVYAHNGLADNMAEDNAELKIFTRAPFSGRSVARCLLDKFLALVDPDFPERAGYDTEGVGMEIGAHVKCTVQKLWVEFYHHTVDHLSWINRWLGASNFYYVGTAEDDHVKSEQKVSHSRFCYTTSR